MYNRTPKKSEVHTNESLLSAGQEALSEYTAATWQAHKLTH